MEYKVVKLATKYAVSLGGKIENINSELIFHQERNARSTMYILNENLLNKPSRGDDPFPVEVGKKFILVNKENVRLLYDVVNSSNIEVFDTSKGRAVQKHGGYLNNFLREELPNMLEPTMEEVQDYYAYTLERKLKV